MSTARRQLGSEGERLAEDLLRRQRYTIVERNYRCRLGEIDLIALEGTVIVFIEVKARTQPGTGSPFEAVSARKQQQVARAAQHYLTTHRLHDRAARFDVVGVWWENDGLRCELLRNAFDVPTTAPRRGLR
jgi:putative endonuclease